MKFILLFILSTSFFNYLLFFKTKPLGLLISTFLLGIFLIYVYRTDFKTSKNKKNEILKLLYIFISSLFFSLFINLFIASKPISPKAFYRYKFQIYIGFICNTLIFVTLFKKYSNNSYKRILKYITISTPFIFVFLTFSYLLNQSNLTSVDTHFARIAPYSLFYENNFDLNEFFGNPTPINNSKLKNNPLMYTKEKLNENESYEYLFVLIRIKDKFYSLYPFLMGVLSSTFYIILKIFGFHLLSPEFSKSILGEPYVAERLSASILGSLTSLLFFRIIIKNTRLTTSLLLLFIYSFASSHFTISSQALWQHGPAEFLLLSIIFYLDKNYKKQNLFNYAALGSLCILLNFIRPSTAIITVFLGIEILYQIWKLNIIERSFYYILTACYKPLFTFSLSAIISFILIGSINYSIYGHPLGGYALFFSKNSSDFYFNTSYVLKNLFSLLFSTNRGLFIYFPYFIIILFLSFFLRRIRVFLFMAAVFFYILSFSRYYAWAGGWSYGPRLLTELMPIFILLLSYSFNLLQRRFPYLNVLFFLLIFYSFFTQIFGVINDYGFQKWHLCNNKEFDEMMHDMENPEILAFLKPYKTVFLNNIIIPADYICASNIVSTNRENGKVKSLDFMEDDFLKSPYFLIGHEFFGKGNYCLSISFSKSSNITNNDLVIYNNTISVPYYTQNNRIYIDFFIKQFGKQTLLVYAKETKYYSVLDLKISKSKCLP